MIDLFFTKVENAFQNFVHILWLVQVWKPINAYWPKILNENEYIYV